MSRLSTHIRTLILIPVLVAGARGQEKTPSEIEAAKEKQAFELLSTVSESIPGLRASQNRIYLASIAADLLWERDEKQARVLFDMLTKEVIAAISAESAPEQDIHLRSNDYGLIQQQRREIMERMARRDPDMALAFLRATRIPGISDLRDFGHQRTTETELELQLAGLIASKDPAQALRLVRATLKSRVTHGVVHVISQLDAKDRSSAQTLHREVVDRLKTEDLAKDYETANAAWNLLSSYRPPQANEETYRELVELLAGFVLSIKPIRGPQNHLAQNHYHYAQTLIEQLEKYAPGRVIALRQWRQNAHRTMDPNAQWHQELNDVAQNGTVDKILALTNSLPSEFQSQIYERAAWKALNDGDVNRARQIINEFIKDPGHRRTLLEQIENQSVWNHVSQNKLSEARQMLDRVKNLEQRVQIMMNMASNLLNRGDKKQAIELLDEAGTLVTSQSTDVSKMMIRLQLAQAYSTLDSEKSAALLEPIIGRVNELIAAAAVLDGFEHRYLKDGEWIRAQYSTLGNLITNLEQSLGQLARADIESARRLSDRLERLEIRLTAQIGIVQALLANRAFNHPPTSRSFGRIVVRRSQ